MARNYARSFSLDCVQSDEDDSICTMPARNY